jgi:16S rRNA (cytidine1402-2'-O)-methyltransferase
VARLYLIPTPIADTPVEWALPAGTLEVVRALTVFIVENAKTARAALKRMGYPRPLQETCMLALSEHTRADELDALLEPLRQGFDVGLMSEAGCPGIADPGAALTRLAHREGIGVVPLVGPSALLLALMGSGLNGQRFAFHGYLPVDRQARLSAIRRLETRSRRDDETELCIETPYRNAALFEALLAACHDTTLVCIASGLMGDRPMLYTAPISEWRTRRWDAPRQPTVFLLYSPAAQPV